MGQIDLSVCQICEAGTYSPEGSDQCIDCPSGSYSEFPGAGYCEFCPPGTSGTEPKQTSTAGCTTCEVGTYNPPDAYDCVPCEPGTFNGKEGNTYCEKCPPGTYNINSGKDSIDYCVECPVGTFSDEGQGECTPCPEGTYGYKIGQTLDGCFKCPPGTYNDETGKTKCKNCPARTHNTLEEET